MSEIKAPSAEGHSSGHQKSGMASLALAALGIVYGDIGTSPLYAMKETMLGKHKLPGGAEVTLARSFENVAGAASLFFWALIIVVTLKYVLLVMRADNHGEGGIFALLGLIRNGDTTPSSKKLAGGLTVMIVIGACLLYGDGMITPAISVLSAVEGIEILTPAFKSAVIPISLAILVALFAIQKRGTAGIGKVFGPIMILWFVALAALGMPWIFKHPEVIKSLNPVYAVKFAMSQGSHILPILGAVVLCITGGEALYADMGHFGPKPIRVSWFSFVLPTLVINYLGQAARLLEPGDIPGDNLFYSLCSVYPSWVLGAMVILATAATVIASQALISGVFSLTQQAIALGFSPRLQIVHTNRDQEGQIYVPFANWVVMAGCLALVVIFGSSSALAAAYGIAVTGTMAITTYAFQHVAIKKWGWHPVLTRMLCLGLIAVDLIFFVANTLKFKDGGYVPMIIAAALFYVFWNWSWGRNKLGEAYQNFSPKPMNWLVDLKGRLMESVHGRLVDGEKDTVQSRRAVVYMVSRPIHELTDNVPMLFRVYLKRHGVLPKHVIFFHVLPVNRPTVDDAERFEIIQLGSNIVSVIMKAGYMESPDVSDWLKRLAVSRALRLRPEAFTVQVGMEEITDENLGFIGHLNLQFFRFVLSMATPADRYYGLEGASRDITTVPVIFAGHSRLNLPELEKIEEEASPDSTAIGTESLLPVVAANTVAR